MNRASQAFNRALCDSNVAFGVMSALVKLAL